CQPELSLTSLGGTKDPILDLPAGAAMEYVRPFFKDGYCTSSNFPTQQFPQACDPAQNTGCGSAECETCVDFFNGLPMCYRNCAPSRTENNCPGENQCMTIGEGTGVCFPAGCQTDEECHLARKDTNSSGEVEPYDATTNPTGDRLHYFPDNGSFMAMCDPNLNVCRHTGNPDAQAGDPCFNKFDCEADGACSEGVCTKFDCDLPGNACAKDGVCIEGACLAGCKVGDHGDPQDPFEAHNVCGENQTCVPVPGLSGDIDGACGGGNFNDLGADDNNIGGSCIADSDCYSPYGLGDCFTSLSFGGMPTEAFCTVRNCNHPSLAGICGDGNACVELFGDGQFYCVQGCATGANCEAGNACYTSGANKYCLPAGCMADADCASGTCNTTTRFCEETCNDGSDCPDGRACVEQAGGGKLCKAICKNESECDTDQTCNAGFLRQLSGGGFERFGRCEDTCVDNSECSVEDEEICAPGHLGATRKACTAICTGAGQCRAGESCDTLDAALGLGLCSDTCTAGGTDPCEAGEACRETTTGDGKVCRAGCLVTADCKGGETGSIPTGQTTGTCGP
ncbi:MAG: hypothetical protein KC416_05120, partial [Myxococcales bacterium]|nr:hypothetical protein [Myxococcales bacterium]